MKGFKNLENTYFVFFFLICIVPVYSLRYVNNFMLLSRGHCSFEAVCCWCGCSLVVGLVLRKSFIVYKKEYQKYGISCWKCYSRNDIDGLCHTNGMRRFLFAHLNEAGLKVIEGKTIIRSKKRLDLATELM